MTSDAQRGATCGGPSAARCRTPTRSPPRYAMLYVECTHSPPTSLPSHAHTVTLTHSRQLYTLQSLHSCSYRMLYSHDSSRPGRADHAPPNYTQPGRIVAQSTRLLVRSYETSPTRERCPVLPMRPDHTCDLGSRVIAWQMGFAKHCVCAPEKLEL